MVRCSAQGFLQVSSGIKESSLHPKDFACGFRACSACFTPILHLLFWVLYGTLFCGASYGDRCEPILEAREVHLEMNVMNIIALKQVE